MILHSSGLCKRAINRRSTFWQSYKEAATGPPGISIFNRTTTGTEMLTDDFPFLLPSNVGGDLPARLRNLADDLVQIGTGAGSGADELANAPLITEWRTVLSPLGLRLLGSVTDHPLLRDRAAMTSQVWAADSEGRWIRTLTRFYRLGAASTARMDHPRLDLEGGL